MLKNDRNQKSAGRILALLAVSLAIIGACLVTVHSSEGFEAAEALSPAGLQMTPGLATDAVSSCPDGLRFVIDGVIYGASGDGVAEVLGFEGYPATDLVIPPVVTSSDGGEYRVVRIADDAFRDMAILESVVIPDTVTEAGRNAFVGCVSLTVLTVPVTVGCHHGDDGYAFKDVLLEELTLTRGVDGPRNEGNEFWKPMTGMLRDLVVEDGIASFTTQFKDSPYLRSVILKDVESLVEDQFRDCPNLATVVAPRVKTIEDNAFMDCPRLDKVDLSSLESLARGAFVHCPNLRTVVSDTLFIDGGQLFMILDDDSVSLIQQLDADPWIIEIPLDVATPSGRNYTVTEIGKEAFREHGNLRTLIISDEVRKVDEHAFQDCRSLDVIAIPIGTDCSCDTGKSAFDGVKPTRLVLTSEGYDPEGYMENEFWKPFSGSLESLVVAEGITDFATSFKGGKLMSVILDSVETVHDGQFEGCDDLVIASFPEAVTVGRSAFKGCDNLVAVDASGARDIGREAFSGCYALGGFIGDSVETVGEKGFYGCVPLAEFNFDSITKVGSQAFHDTAVTGAPSSKSHCFAKDSFGSSLSNVVKVIAKNKWASITTGVAAVLGIVLTGEVIHLIKLDRKYSETLNGLISLRDDTELGIESTKETLNNKTNSWHHSGQGNRIDQEKLKLDKYQAEMEEVKYEKSLNKWKLIIVVTAVATSVAVSTSIYLWNTDT